MKLLILIFLTMFTVSGFTFDTHEDASAAEVNFLCHAVNKQLENWHADMALDTANCSSVQAKVYSFSKGLKIVSAKLTFNAPSRPSFQLDCQAAYMGDIENNVSFGINCK